MNRLSALDASFLYMETSDAPMNIGSVSIFAPIADSREETFKKFRDHTEARLDLLPSYRRRLQATPLAVDHPVWIDVDSLDLDYHIQRRAVARPGTMDQLRRLVAELHKIPLDRARPLWQYYFIDGFEDGGFAVYIKIRHATMDGLSGIAALPVIYDFLPDPAPVPVRVGKTSDRAERPGFRQLLGGFLDHDVRLIESGPKVALALANLSRRAAKAFRLLPESVRLAPRTLFNVSITRERSYGTASVSLSDIKRVAKARHATVNDVLMAICAGALRRYLADRKSLPRKSLIAAVPISLREPGHAEMTNQVGAILCSLATDIADPLERLAAIAAVVRDAKARFVDLKELLPTEISFPGAPLMATGLARLAARMRAHDFLPNVMNLWLSSIPGPRQPMYCAGARATHHFPVSIPSHGLALNITAQSYVDSIEFGLTACRATVPDAQAIADHIGEEFAVLAQAIAAVGDVGAVEIIEIAVPAAAEKALPPKISSRANGARAARRAPVAVAAFTMRGEKRARRTPEKPAESAYLPVTPTVKNEQH